MREPYKVLRGDVLMNSRIQELIDRSMMVSIEENGSFVANEFARELAYSVIQECCDIIEEAEDLEDGGAYIARIDRQLSFDDSGEDYETD